MKRTLDKMFSSAVKIVFMLILAGGFLSACAQIKETGRTIGHTTRDVTTEIGHGARDVTREIGHGARDVVRGAGERTRDGAEEVKKVVKPAAAPAEY